MGYTVQCRDYIKKNCKSVNNYFIVIGAAIKCNPYSETTVESRTQLKTVKITLNIFAVCMIWRLCHSPMISMSLVDKLCYCLFLCESMNYDKKRYWHFFVYFDFNGKFMHQ